MSYKLSVGSYPDPSQPRRFDDSSRFDNISLSVTPVELLASGSEISTTHGTGFFWETGDRLWLITNWHNVTGKNPFTLEPLSRTGFSPSSLRIFLPQQQRMQTPYFHLKRAPCVIPLFTEAGDARWLECPEFETIRTDIVALPLGEIAVGRGHTINKYDISELMHLVGNDLFVVGYPFKNYDGIMLPIWKRGSFATEPMWPVDRKPMVLIDAATRPGMSGSPVFARRYGPAAMKNLSIDASRILSTEFVGVYSGHLGTGLDEITVGIVWYSNLVSRLISAGVQGKIR